MEKMAKISGLQRRGLTYFLRVRVPKDLSAYFKNKEIIRTLETRDYDLAAKRVHTVRAGIEADFEKKRQEINAKAANTDMLSGYTDHQLTALASKWFHDIKAKKEKRLFTDAGTWSEERKYDYAKELQYEEFIAREEKIGTSIHDKHDGFSTAREFLENNGLSYNPSSDNFRKLGHFFSKAIHEFARQNLLEWQGKQYIPSNFVGAANQSSFTPQKSISMEMLIEEFLSDQKLGRSKSTQNNYLIIIRAIKEVIGSDTPVHNVSREQCKEIACLLRKMPTNAFKLKYIKTIDDAIKAGEKYKLRIVSDATYNMYMQKFSALMEYAVNEGYISANPAKKLTVKDSVKKKDKKNPFNLEQLQIIFGSEIYQQKNALLYKDGQKPSEMAIYAKYWVPLIGLFTGMRLNEICQLYINDIEKISDVYVIAIRTTNGDEDDIDTEKRVKTANGIRLVPIHPLLIRAGLLDFVESVENSGKTRIFCELTTDIRGYYSGHMTQWFGRFLKKIGAKTPKTSFHSFRHTFRDAIRKAKLSRDATLQLGGWSSKSVDDNYGSGLEVRELYDEICYIKYDGLDLSPLYK